MNIQHVSYSTPQEAVPLYYMLYILRFSKYVEMTHVRYVRDIVAMAHSVWI